MKRGLGNHIESVTNTKNFSNEPVKGRCAYETLAFVFDLDFIAIKAVVKALNLSEDGLTYMEMKKAIRFLCDIRGKQFEYFRNKDRIPAKKFHANFKSTSKKNSYIINSDGHTLTYKNGRFYDNFGNASSWPIFGWFRITDRKEPSRYDAILPRSLFA